MSKKLHMKIAANHFSLKLMKISNGLYFDFAGEIMTLYNFHEMRSKFETNTKLTNIAIKILHFE